tara:strand:- start:626 stop:1120 length:495 start_codon:yes stop_codon:yes gene_type:complete
MKTLLEIAYDKHDIWIKTVISFGCNSSMAEDVVQEMYLQLSQDLNKGIDFTFKDDVNYFYCYKVLRGLFLTICKKQRRVKKIYLEEMRSEPKQNIAPAVDEVKYAKNKDQVDNVLDQMFWYNKKVFEIVASGKSIAKLSRETGISYYSLYNTYTKAKKHIKNNV